MTPRFSAAVDQVFRAGLLLIERIERGEVLDPAREQQHLLAVLAQGRMMGGAGREWKLAEYALTSWLDELLVDTPWNGQDWWSNNVLEMQLYQTRECHERFFNLADEAAESPRRDALQVFHDCVVLGFRGLYRPSSRTGELTRRQRLPATVAEWLQRTQLSIRMGEGRPIPSRAVHAVQGARPLTSTTRVVWVWATVMLLAVVNLVGYRLWPV